MAQRSFSSAARAAFLLSLLFSACRPSGGGVSELPPRIVLEPAGSVMVLVPEGPFLMGSDEGKADARPARTVYLSAFYVDRTEVTNEAYLRFARETGRHMPAFGFKPELTPPLHPVVGVNRPDGQAFAAWAGKRLPTEAEWEKAARGTDGRLWPWGSEFDKLRANYRGDDDPYRMTAPVGSFPGGASPWGALDMAGNVYEWCADNYDPDYYRHAPDRDPPPSPNGEKAVIRGGDWVKGRKASLCYERYWRTIEGVSPGIGFRCVLGEASARRALREGRARPAER